MEFKLVRPIVSGLVPNDATAPQANTAPQVTAGHGMALLAPVVAL